MKKTLFLTLTIALIFGFGFVINKTVAGEEECPAAPDVAGELLEEVGIDNRYGTGRDGGNYIGDVARHMGSGTDFEYPEGNIVNKCDTEAYKIAIALFLRSKGADVGADLFEAVLESVIYEGICNKFGSHIDDKITFTFSKDVFHDPNIEVTFETAQRLWEGWGADDWDFNGNTAIVTPNRLYKNPRDMVDDKVMDITGMIDSIGNPVVVPDGGVPIEIICTGEGVPYPCYSGATFEDNQNRTGTIFITVKDCCGDGIEGFGMDDIEIDLPLVGEIKTLSLLDSQGYWNVSLEDKGDGEYEALFTRLGSITYTRTWGVIVGGTNIGDVDVKFTDATATLESVAYEGTCCIFGSHADETLTFTFSNDVSLTRTYPHVMFDGVSTIGTGPLNWSVEDGNKVIITTTGTFNNPRPKIGDIVTGFNYIVDTADNPVTVPGGGVEVTAGEIIGHGVLDTKSSGTEFVDNGDGTGTLTTTLIDICGNPILPEDFPIVPPTTTREEDEYPDSFRNYFRANAESKDNDHFYYIGASHFPATEGFTRATHEGDGIYVHTITKPCGHEDIWEIGIGPWLFRDDVYVIQDEVKIEINCIGEGVCPEKSFAMQNPIEGYKNEMTATVLDCCGQPIEELTMDDIKFEHGHTERTLSEYHDEDRCWEVSDFSCDEDGVCSWVMYRFCDDRPKTWDNWSISVFCPSEDEWIKIHEGEAFEIKE